MSTDVDGTESSKQPSSRLRAETTLQCWRYSVYIQCIAFPFIIIDLFIRYKIMTQMTEEFTLYGIAFAMRPFGVEYIRFFPVAPRSSSSWVPPLFVSLQGLVFGYIGDKWGRVYSLRASLFAMMIPTVLYAVLPSYSSIGITSTVLVFVFRVLQGLSCGGEMLSALCVCAVVIVGTVTMTPYPSGPAQWCTFSRRRPKTRRRNSSAI